MNKVQILQNKLMKMLLRIDRLTPTEALHRKLNILKVRDIYECNLLSFVNDILIRRCPEVFTDYFVLKQNAYDLRTKGQLVVPSARIMFGDRQVKIKGAQLWNRLPKDLLNKRLNKSFKNSYTKYVISKYLP